MRSCWSLILVSTGRKNWRAARPAALCFAAGDEPGSSVKLTASQNPTVLSRSAVKRAP
jgi:hypothetical protein